MYKRQDYERMKYHSFASMSNEVQFEFTEEPPMIVLSDWSDHKLDLPEICLLYTSRCV